MFEEKNDETIRRFLQHKLLRRNDVYRCNLESVLTLFFIQNHRDLTLSDVRTNRDKRALRVSRIWHLIKIDRKTYCSQASWRYLSFLSTLERVEWGGGGEAGAYVDSKSTLIMVNRKAMRCNVNRVNIEMRAHAR